MLIANVADIHARGKDLEACRSQLAGLVAECVKRGVDLVTFAGDIFDRPSIGDSHASTGAIAEVVIGAVAELTKHGAEVLMIPGNHDVSGAGSADALHVFDGMAGVKVARTILWRRIQDRPHNVAVLCFPWIWDGADPCKVLNDFLVRQAPALPDSLTRRTMLLAHVRVTGAKMSRDFTCDPKPGDWQVSRGFLESLPFDHFALGDFHGRQDLTEGRGGYAGALRQLTFGEEGNPAGFECWDTATGATEWVELDAAPRHYTFEAQAAAINAGHDLSFACPEARDADHVRMQIVGGNPDCVTVKQLEAEGLTVEHIIDREERTQRAKVPEGIVGKPHDLMRLWAGTQTPKIEGERLDRMLRLYDEVHADEEKSDATR